MKFGVPYPVTYLEKMGLSYDSKAVITREGISVVPLRESTIHKDGSFLDALQTIYENFQIEVDETKNFKHLENIYSFREPIVKYREGPENRFFGHLLWQLAKDYQRLGISYAELSFSKIKFPEWLKVLDRELPLIEEQLGVKLRFLVSMQRNPEQNGEKGDNQKIVDQVMALEKNPYIVGVDIVGEEIHDLEVCAPVLERLADYRKQKAPHFQVRIHAGETNIHPGNVKKGLELGATRIGHGVYGIDQEVINLALKGQVIIEMNLDSNFALENILDLAPFQQALRSYLDHGVRVTLGTDGHGIYNNSLQTAEAVLSSLNLSPEDWEKIRQSNEEYVHQMEKVFKLKKEEWDKIRDAFFASQAVDQSSTWTEKIKVNLLNLWDSLKGRLEQLRPSLPSQAFSICGKEN